jgi:serine/threonine protein kinase
MPAIWHSKYNRASGNGVQSRLKLCVNIAAAINTIHSIGKYVLVDLKPQNVLITNDGRISLIDLDSIQIANGNRVVFSAQVATPEYVPLEGNYINPGKDLIPESWDRFSLAVVFYELLFGLHPYAASYQGPYHNSSTLADGIKSGLFVFGSKRNYILTRPPLHDNFARIPSPLQNLFLQAFDNGNSNPNQRPKAEEWGRTIFNEINNPTQSTINFTGILTPSPSPTRPIPGNVSTRKAPTSKLPAWVIVLAILLFIMLVLIITKGNHARQSSSGSPPTLNCRLYNDDLSQNNVNVRANCDTKSCDNDLSTLAGAYPNNTLVKINKNVRPINSGRYTWIQIVILETGRTVWVASSKVQCN